MTDNEPFNYQRAWDNNETPFNYQQSWEEFINEEAFYFTGIFTGWLYR